MHQCTTDVLCNLAGLIFGLAFHPSSFLLKTNTISLLSKAGVFYVSFCAFECEIIFHGHPTIKKKKKKTGTVPPQEGTNMFIHDYS